VSRVIRATEIFVRARANGFCEYCHLPDHVTDTPFQVDHIVARKHSGRDETANLAYSCFYCNTYKGPNVAGVDPRNGKIIRLYNPRKDKWTRHFRWDGAVLVGLTASGRATIETLRINHPDAVSARAALIGEGEFPQ
jgi:hypothetical protein